MRPTALGVKALVFHGLLTAAFYVSPYTNLYFLLLSFFGALILTSALWTRRHIRGVVARIDTRRPVPAATSGARVGVVVEAPRPRHGLQVVLSIEGIARPIVLATCDAGAPDRPTRAEGELPALPRGVHRVLSASVRTSAPLGLWCAHVRAEASAAVIVHARAVPGASVRGDLPLAGAGEHPVGAAAASGDAGAAGLRAFRAGDALRAVHWRATARRRTPIVREFEDTADRGVCVLLDRRSTPERLERGLSELVTIALRARERGDRLELRSQGLTATFGEGVESFDALLRWTAEATVTDAAPPRAPADAIRLPGAVTARPGGGR